MIQKDLFSEFIDLEWKAKYRNLDWKEKDLVLGDFIIARVNNSGCTIHYLTNGNSVSIPKPWLDIFSVLNVHSGAKLIHLGETGDSIDRTIYLMLTLTLFLEINRGSEILENLGKLSEIRTEEFRSWIEDVHGIILDPIKFRTINVIVEI